MLFSEATVEEEYQSIQQKEYPFEMPSVIKEQKTVKDAGKGDENKSPQRLAHAAKSVADAVAEATNTYNRLIH